MTRILSAWLDDDDPEKEHDKNEGMKPEQPMAPVQMALFKARTVLIFGEIDMKVAERVCGQLIAYAAEGNGDIRVIINSPGGHVESGFCESRGAFVGPGSVALRLVRDLFSCATAPLTARLPAAAAKAAEPTPRNPRRENLSLVPSFSIACNPPYPTCPATQHSK